MLDENIPLELALEESKRRLALIGDLESLAQYLSMEELLTLQRWIIAGDYVLVYAVLLSIWKTKAAQQDDDFIKALVVAGMGAGHSADKISEDMV